MRRVEQTVWKWISHLVFILAIWFLNQNKPRVKIFMTERISKLLLRCLEHTAAVLEALDLFSPLRVPKARWMALSENMKPTYL